MRIDYAKLKKAGFQVREDSSGIEIFSHEPIESGFVDNLRKMVKDPLLQDIFVNNTLVALETVQILDALR